MSTSQYNNNFLSTRHGRVISEGARTGEDKMPLDFLDFLATVVGVLGTVLSFLFERRSMWTCLVSAVGVGCTSELLFTGIITISEKEEGKY